MKALARRLTAEGRYAALRFSCQNAQVFPDDVGAAEKAVWSEIEESARDALPELLWPPARVAADPGSFLKAQLARWAAVCPLPLVLIFDEIDAIGCPSLRSILSQLRTGFDNRPGAFPWSAILCGMRDVRDYKAASGGDPARLGTSSPFNIKEKSLRIVNFTEAEVRELYAQHTADTGQVFTEKALERAFTLTQGQPWLCNALAREVVEEIAVPPDEAITAAHIDAAKERLILARATHLDSLLARLREKPVRRILGPVLAGTLRKNPSFDADFEYVTDLGLVAPRPPPRIANPIYQEVILRVLARRLPGQVGPVPRGAGDLRRAGRRRAGGDPDALHPGGDGLRAEGDGAAGVKLGGLLPAAVVEARLKDATPGPPSPRWPRCSGGPGSPTSSSCRTREARAALPPHGQAGCPPLAAYAFTLATRLPPSVSGVVCAPSPAPKKTPAPWAAATSSMWARR
jgi:hypothetical protein